MNIIKICMLNYAVQQQMEEKIQQLVQLGIRIHVQKIDAVRYQRWMKYSMPMPWVSIIDIYCFSAGMVDEVCKCLGGPDCTCTDIYITRIFQEYQTPVHGAEIITSCYRWNENCEPKARDKVMHEHFEMEKLQKYYNYVVFQVVEKTYTENSPALDFFFVSHVSDPEGIDCIYSMPALNGMREHSQAFLDTNTRQLAFGTVGIIC